MTRREELEMQCAVLFGKETDVKKRLAILRNAYWQATNAGYCDAMANRLMGGREDAQTDFWDKACSLKWEAAALCDIYSKELGEEAE